MDKNEFGAFVKKAIREPRTDTLERNMEIWNDYSQLYEKITGWLQEYIDKGQITVEEEVYRLFERCREFKLPSFEITLGEQTISLTPQEIDFRKGTGTVAMSGEEDSFYFTLQGHDGPWVCKTFSSGQSEKELDEETFLQLFMEVCTPVS